LECDRKIIFWNGIIDPKLALRGIEKANEQAWLVAE
jgi:hypothetical protein